MKYGKNHTRIIFWIWLSCLLFVFITGPVSADNDLLTLPSIKSRLATHSLLLDVTKTGNRLVAVGERGHIIYSDDYGTHWTQADVPVSVTLTAVTFPTPASGWAVGHDGVVLHSRDAGCSWHIQTDGLKLNPLMVSAVARIVEYRKNRLNNAPPDRRKVLAGEVEDAQFFLNDVSAAVEEKTAYPFMDVWFGNEKEGLVFGAFGMIFRTEDGGKTWSAIADHVASANGFHYYAAGETVGGFLFVVGESGTLLRSKDRGRTWQKLASPYPGSLFGLVADDRSSCLLGVGLRGNAIHINEDGLASQVISGFGEESLFGGTFLNDKTMVVVGMSPEIFINRTDGKSFHKMPTPFPGCMAVEDAGDGTLLLVGIGGIYKMSLGEAKE